VGQSGIKAVESTHARLALYIPGGGPQATLPNRRAQLWSMLAVGVTLAAAVLACDAPPGNESGLLLCAFLAVLWIFALRHVWRWIKLRYPRILLCLDRGQIVVERILWLRRSLETLRLGPGSRAELVEAFSARQDWSGRRIDQIEVRGTNGSVRFGTSLADLEKAWLVDRINEFIQMTSNESAISSKIES
jgi:hypothetical protein